MKLGEQGHLLATAATNVAFDSAVAGTGALLTGAPVLGAAAGSAATFVLPTFVGYETANFVGKAMDDATKDWKNRDAAHAVSGGTTGAAAAGSGMLTYVGLAKAYNGIKLLRAARTGAKIAEAAGDAVGEGTEMAGETVGEVGDAVGEVAETTGEVGEAVGALGTAEETAGEVSLLPIPGARAVGAIIAIGALIGIGFASLFHHEDSPEEKERKRAAAQKQLEDEYHKISVKYIKAQRANKFNVKKFSPLQPKDVLTDGEIQFMLKHQPKYFDAVNKSLKSVYDYHIQKRKALISKTIKDYGISEDTKFGRMKLTIREYLNEIDNGDISSDDLQLQLNELEMNKLHIKNINDYNTLTDVHESERKDIYSQIITKQSKEAGYLNPVDYLTDQKSGNTNQKNVELHVADSYDEVRIKAEKEGFYSTDEAVFANAVDMWTPDQSAILRAHQQGFSMKTFNDYMHRFSAGLPQQVYYPGAKEQEEDIDNFKEDLVYAGYKPNAYTYTVNDHGFYEFARNQNVPLERDPTQIAEVAMLRETGHSSELNEGIKSGNYSVSELISNLSNKYLFTQTTFTPFYGSKDDMWAAYENFRPTSRPSDINVMTHNLIKHESDKILRLGLSEEDYHLMKHILYSRGQQMPTEDQVMQAVEDVKNIPDNIDTQDKFKYISNVDLYNNSDDFSDEDPKYTQFHETNKNLPDLTNDEIDRLEDGEEVTSSVDHSTYASE
jgi:hypothetical protein